MDGLLIEDFTVHVRARGVPVQVRIDRLVVKRGERAAYRCNAAVGEALLRALAGLDGQASGTVLVDGVVPQGHDVHERKIAVVAAGGGLLPHLRVRENILYGAGATQGTTGAVAQEVLPNLERDMLLTPAVQRRPHELSTRELVLRVGLARAAISEPAALVVHLPECPENPGRLPEMLRTAMVRHARPPAVLVLTDHQAVIDALACDEDKSW